MFKPSLIFYDTSTDTGMKHRLAVNVGKVRCKLICADKVEREREWCCG